MIVLKGIRKPAVAGLFYPNNLLDTTKLIKSYLDLACTDLNNKEIGIKYPRIFIAPHAGYIYSGLVAAYSYCTILKRKNWYNKFIIMGPAHTVYFKGVALDSHKYWAINPSNSILIEQDSKIIKDLNKLPFVQIYDTAHIKEHDIEVQLPFLYYIYGDNRSYTDFTFVSALIGDVNREQMYKLAVKLATLMNQDRSLALIISSDLSHYLPYNYAKEIDLNTVSRILNLVNSWQFEKDKIKLDNALKFDMIDTYAACGAFAINTGIITARMLNFKAELLQYLNSADTAGDTSSVVGYASIIMGHYQML